MLTLSEYLAKTGTKQRKFAADIGVREATVSFWVNGGTPRPAQMQRIAEVTGGAVPVTAWFGAAKPAAERTGNAA